MGQQIILTVLCLVIILGALAFAGWTLVSGQIQRQGIDALFLVTICLLIAVMFLPIPLGALRRGELKQWLKGRAKSKSAASGEAPNSAEKVKQHSV